MKSLIQIISILSFFVGSDLLGNSLGVESIDSGLQIGKHLSIATDKDNEWGIDDVRQLADDKFELQEVDAPTFGFQPFTIWGKFTLENSSEQTKEMVLKYNYPMADYVTLYSPDGKELGLGDRTPFDRQEFHSRTPAFKLNVPLVSIHSI